MTTTHTRDPYDLAMNDVEPVIVAFEQHVVGHELLGERMLIALIAKKCVLLKGVPGTAKTRSCKALSKLVDLEFNRIQFTPDLLPSDVTGSSIYRRATEDYKFRPGPIFAGVVLGDEINRASPKTQSALLEAMEERQVTVDGVTRPLHEPFIVMATMNPIEHEGTYPLPEAQLDRFLFELEVDNVKTEEDLNRIDDVPSLDEITSLLTAEDILKLQGLASSIKPSGTVQDYRTKLVFATRNDERILVPASDRRSPMLLEAAKARAVIHGRSYVTAKDVYSVFADALRHVLVLKPEAQMDGITNNQVIAEILASVPMPKGE